MEPLNIQTHTIVITVAPSGAGKSYFCENRLVPSLREQYKKGLQNKHANIQHLSSDAIREELLGYQGLDRLPKLTHEGEVASKQAFELLEAKLRAVTSYPISAEVVIVDTMGSDSEFRKIVFQLADEMCYNVCVLMFDYPTIEDYLEHTPESEQWLTKKLFKPFKKDFEYIKEFVKNYKFKNRNSKQVYTIPNKNFGQIPIVVSDLEAYNKICVSTDVEYSVVGDIHGCLDEFKEMVFKLGFSVNKDGEMKEMKSKSPDDPVKLKRLATQ